MGKGRPRPVIVVDTHFQIAYVAKSIMIYNSQFRFDPWQVPTCMQDET